jgi:DNA-binding YbaB/EbfC family protein
MNLQAMMQQAQKLQKDMMKEKQQIEEKIFNYKQSFVEVEANGKKEILKIKIDKEASLEKDDLEMLEDMIVLAINETFKQIDKETEQRMGKFGSGLSGLF